jgi:hypothetical protein
MYIFVNHYNTCIPRIVNNSNNIPICECIIQQFFEVWFEMAMFDHCVIELCTHDLLRFGVFRLHVANNNGHDLIMSRII